MTASFRPLANKARELARATAGGMIDARLAVPGHPERDRRLDWEAMKTRVLLP